MLPDPWITRIRHLSEPIFVGMTATEELIAKQVSDVFPASVDDLPLTDAARREVVDHRGNRGRYQHEHDS